MQKQPPAESLPPTGGASCQPAGPSSAYGNRRVAGLRRGDVAALLGVSVEDYTRLERGNLAGAFASILDALARALQLPAAGVAVRTLDSFPARVVGNGCLPDRRGLVVAGRRRGR